MKPHAVLPGELAAERLVGWVLCHDLRDPSGRLTLRKGQVLDAEAAARLVTTATAEVHLLEMEPGDVHEDPAGRRLAEAAAGRGIAIRGPSGGQWALVAEHRGILRVKVSALAAVNALEGISVYTLYDEQVVERGEVVARAKVTPLVVAEATVLEAEARGRAPGGLVAVRGFRPLGVAAVAPASLEERARRRFTAALGEKLAWFGARLRGIEFAPAEPVALARALEAGRAAGVGLIVAAGANALDPLDPVFAALERLGGRVVRQGIPAHPGSLLWLASLDTTPILGMPSCGMFSEATVFDLVLPRLLAGEPVGAVELAAFGHGGLLGRDMAFRFPAYRAGQDRGALPE